MFGLRGSTHQNMYPDLVTIFFFKVLMMRESERMVQQNRAGPAMAAVSLVLGVSGTETPP